MEPTTAIESKPRRRSSKEQCSCCQTCGKSQAAMEPKQRKPRAPHPLKGTDEMKERMAAIRALKKSRDGEDERAAFIIKHTH